MDSTYKGGRRSTTFSADDIAGKIKFFRQQRGWTQAELAEGICSTSLISQIENGRGGTTVEMLMKLADKLGIPLRELYTDNGGEYPNFIKIELAEAYILRDELDIANDMLRHLAESDDLLLNEKHQLVLLQGMFWNKNGMPDKAKVVLSGLIDQIEEEQELMVDDQLVCRLYNLLGNACYQLRNFAEAYSSYKRAYQLAMRLPAFEMLAATVAYNLGMICNELEISGESLVYLQKAHDFFESFSDFGKLANTYFYLAVATKEERYINRALEIYKNLEILKLAGVAKRYQAVYFDSKRDYKKASLELKVVADEMDKLGDHQNCLYTLAWAAILCLNQSDVKNAKPFIDAAIEYKDKFFPDDGKDDWTALYHRALAMYNFQIGNDGDGITHAQKSSELFERAGKYSESADSLELVVVCYQSQGKHDVALQISQNVVALLRRLKG